MTEKEAQKKIEKSVNNFKCPRCNGKLKWFGDTKDNCLKMTDYQVDFECIKCNTIYTIYFKIDHVIHPYTNDSDIFIK